MKRLNAVISIFLCYSLFSARSQAFDPVIQSVIDDVNLDSLMQYVRELTGETAVQIGSEQAWIRSRHMDYTGNGWAADYIQQRLESWGYSVTLQDFSATGRNVIAAHLGTEEPGQILILCAHYDCMPDEEIAPGADDNASGVAGVLETARILANRSCHRTVLFALWDEEEQGCRGSEMYVYNLPAEEKNILYVINMDMIAWDSDDDYLALIGTGNDPSSKWIASIVHDVNLEHMIGLELLDTSSIIYSDQITFHDADFPAIGLHENIYGDKNEYYHNPGDVAAHFNQDYFYKICQLSAGTAATLAVLDPESKTDEQDAEIVTFQFEPSYPNPFNSATLIPVSLGSPGYIKIEVFDLSGRVVAVLADGNYPEGSYNFLFYANGLSSGVYTCRVITEACSAAQKMLLIK